MWVTRAGAIPNSVGPQLRTPTLNRQSRRVGRTSTMWRNATVTCPSPRACTFITEWRLNLWLARATLAYTSSGEPKARSAAFSASPTPASSAYSPARMVTCGSSSTSAAAWISACFCTNVHQVDSSRSSRSRPSSPASSSVRSIAARPPRFSMYASRIAVNIPEVTGSVSAGCSSAPSRAFFR